MPFLQGQNYDAVDKENTISRNAEKTAPVCPCELLCQAMGAGWHPCPLKQVCSPCQSRVAEIGDDCWNTFSPKTEGEPTG